MTYVPHWRLSLLGKMGGTAGAEIFSMNLALDKFAGAEGLGLAGLILDPNDTVWDDVWADCAAWFGSSLPGPEIHPSAVLTGIKIAAIGADGRYTAAPVERGGSVPGAAGGGRLPNQCAVATTLGTAGDLGRIKGRFYVPIPGVTLEADGRLPEAVAEGMETAAVQLVNNLNNQPGIDVLDIRVCVASQGRRNKDGTVRVPPGNHTVTHVGVGRVVDTIRSRRSALEEQRDMTAVAPPAG